MTAQEYKYSNNYDDPLLAELYDGTETQTDDVDLIRKLIADSGPLSILECFSGTGRILVLLAQDGHRITGIELAYSMNARAAEKVARLGHDVRQRVTLRVQDVLDGHWGFGYDLVIIGANAFYELPSGETQEKCIRFARESLAPGGRLFVDNDDYKGDWAKGPFGRERVVFEGTGENGTFGRETVVGLRFDEERGVLYMRRAWATRTRDGQERRRVLLTRKHPVAATEVRSWLKEHGFEVLETFGDRQGSPYTEASERAIFWAKKV